MVVGARVSARRLATNREFKTETNSAGLLALRDLPPGDRNVEIPQFSKEGELGSRLAGVGNTVARICSARPLRGHRKNSVDTARDCFIIILIR